MDIPGISSHKCLREKNSVYCFKKRRVNELFAENIPQDEAFLMSNGRFACTVCNQRPVFDTINMLAIHRQGKKHLNSLQYHNQKKQELKDLIRRRKHEQFLKDGTTDIKMANIEDKRSGLLGACVYDPRMKRQKCKPHERKLRVNLNDKCEAGPDCAPSGTTSSSLPGYTKAFYQCSEPVIHSRKLKDAFGDKRKERDMLCVQPYVKKSYTCPSTTSNLIPPVNFDPKHCNNSQPPHTSLLHSQRNSHGLNLATLLPPPAPPPSTAETSSSKKVKKKHSSEKLSGPDEGGSKTDKQLKTEQYLKLTESGWKRDRGGNWVKDEEVEFDSDEETPTLQ